MAYTRITNTRDGAAAIRYAFEEPSHREGMDRVLMASGSNLDTLFAMQQMRATWKSHRKSDGKTVQMYRIVQSFGLDELDPWNTDDIAKANEIGQELAAELYPDKQALIVTQADGKGGKLHNHVLVNSVGFIDGKSLRGYRKEHEAVAEKSDEILVRHDMKPLDTEKMRIKRTSTEKLLAKSGKYVFKDDLRERIDETLKNINVTSREAFIERLEDAYGVGVTYRDRRKNVTYSFVDRDGKKRKVRDYNLGTDYQYGKEKLKERFEDNAKLLEAEKNRQKEEETKSSRFSIDYLSIDFGEELEKIRGPKSKTTAPRETAETEIMRQVRVEREQKKKVNSDHASALEENQRRNEVLRQQQLEAEARDRARIEAQKRKEQAERDTQLRKEEKERLEIERKHKHQEALKQYHIKRIQQGIGAKWEISDETLKRYLVNEEKYKDKTYATVTGKRKSYSINDIYIKTKNEMETEKRNPNYKLRQQEYMNISQQNLDREL